MHLFWEETHCLQHPHFHSSSDACIQDLKLFWINPDISDEELLPFYTTSLHMTTTKNGNIMELSNADAQQRSSLCMGLDWRSFSKKKYSTKMKVTRTCGQRETYQLKWASQQMAFTISFNPAPFLSRYRRTISQEQWAKKWTLCKVIIDFSPKCTHQVALYML